MGGAKMEAVGYVRVSSKAQGHATQRAEIERAARARRDRVVRWYSEKLSGGTMARPVLERLRHDVRAGKVRRLYLYRLDRLTRTGIADTLQVVEELRRHGCEVASVADGFDLAGPAAEIVLAVLAWAAKTERLAINERIAAARRRIEAEGGAWGRPRTMDDRQVNRAAALRRSGLSVREVARRMNVPKSTIARALRDAA